MDKVKAIISVIGDAIKKHIKLIIALVVIVVAIIVVCTIFLGSPKKTVKKFAKAIEDGDSSKIVELIDTKGMYVFMEKAKFSDKKFDDKYKDFDGNDEYEEFEEEFEENVEDLLEEMDDEGFSISLEEIKDVEKSKNSKKLYKVKTKVKIESDDDDETLTVTIYVVKNGLSYKVVGVSEDSLEELSSTVDNLLSSSYSDYDYDFGDLY